MTEARLDHRKAAPEAFAAMLNLAKVLHASSIPTQLRALVELRVSQVNGCAYCCDMHAREARAAGVSQLQLDCLSGWEDAPCYDLRTRAALSWAEAVTLIRETRAPQALYEQALQQFTERELAELTLIATTINAWNRLQVAFRVPPTGAR